MTAPVNDRDVLLQAATIRNLSVGTTRALLLTSDTQVFHVTTGGAGSPSSINFTASLLGITGTVAFAASPTCTLTGTGLTRALTFTAFGANQQVTITATVTDTFSGQVFTATQVVNRVADGATGGAGGPGPAGSQSGISYLYQFSSISPATPTGVATYSWNAATTTYSNTDSWRGTVPSNPGTPGVQLWVLIAPLTAPAGTLTSTVSFSGISPVAYSSNGANGGAGGPGAPGVKNTVATAYQWNTSTPTAIGPATYTWATASYDTPPSTGWSATKPPDTTPGKTLYEARVGLVDSTGAVTSVIDWSNASVVGIAYNGNNGATGPQGPTGPQGGTGGTGSQGASARIAYTLITGNTLATTPATLDVVGDVLPNPVGTWGETASWTATPGVAGANQAVFQSNGIYNPATGHTIWTTPYLSNLKVGNLAALSTNTGALTVTGAINAGSGTFTVAPDGTVVAKNLSIQKADGTVILSSGVPLAISYAPAGTVNSNITLNANGTLSGAGSGAVTIAGLDNTVLRSGTQITAANASTYIANAGIDGTYISNLTAGSIAARTITAAQVAAGTLTANEILVGSLTADRIQANSLTSTQIQAGGITADRLNIGGNPNLVPNSGPKIINKGWTYGSAYSGTINGLYFADPTAATYAPPGLSGLWVQFPQTPNPNPTGYIDIYGDLFFVTPNAFYECSAYLSTVRASATIYISWNNGADQFIRGSVESNAINFVNPAYTSPLSDWNAIGRATMSIQVPADSGITKARFVVRVRPNESTGNGYCFASGMMMAEKKANQTSFSDYKPGGSAGVQIDASGITTPNLSSLSATIGTLRTATTGARTEIADNQMRVYDAANTLRVIVGSF